MAATRADRTGGNYNVFQNGVYTACAPCKDNPKKPPLWQVKGARIIHDQTDKMLYFENAQLEFFGVPMAYLPYFSTPDPTVKRKTGFLMPGYTQQHRPSASASKRRSTGRSRRTTTLPSTRASPPRQGVLMQGEFRQRLIDGAYQIRAYGIDQLDHGAFAGQPGDRQFRGGVDTKGQFALNDKWVWGWDGVLLSDYAFFSDYRLAQYQDPLGSFLSLPTEAISQLYLTGVGNRSFFDARTIYYLQLLRHRLRTRFRSIHPVIDYSNVINQPDPRRRVQLQDQFHQPDARRPRQFDPITTLANTNGLCSTDVGRPAGADCRRNCLLRGVPGTYTRLTGEAQWRTSFTDPVGQIWTPFAIAARRCDRRLDLEPARRFEFPASRRHPGAAGDADGRPRISLSLHQRSAVGHHDDRADRAGHRPSERKLCRQAAQRRRAEHGVRRQQPVRASTSSPATTASKAAAAPMSASRPPPSSTAAARSTCCSASPTSCSA